MKDKSYDLIGDIHGQHDKLAAILNCLGCAEQGEFAGWSL
jgi:hypothetical protein